MFDVRTEPVQKPGEAWGTWKVNLIKEDREDNRSIPVEPRPSCQVTRSESCGRKLLTMHESRLARQAEVPPGGGEPALYPYCSMSKGQSIAQLSHDISPTSTCHL
jgi:hypothetical protein